MKERKKIITVIDATFAVAKRKPEKILAWKGFKPLTSVPAILIYDFHIFLTSSSSFHRFITNQLYNLLPVGLLAQLVERCTGITEVKGSDPVQA